MKTGIISAWLICTAWAMGGGQVANTSVGFTPLDLLGSGLIARSLSVTGPADARLEFAWRSSLPAGTSFIVEVNDGSWKTLFSRSAVSQSAWINESLPLSAYAPSTALELRCHTSGIGAAAGIDQVRLAWHARENLSRAIQLRSLELVSRPPHHRRRKQRRDFFSPTLRPFGRLSH
jgi:hypothetical protein